MGPTVGEVDVSSKNAALPIHLQSDLHSSTGYRMFVRRTEDQHTVTLILIRPCVFLWANKALIHGQFLRQC